MHTSHDRYHHRHNDSTQNLELFTEIFVNKEFFFFKLRILLVSSCFSTSIFPSSHIFFSRAHHTAWNHCWEEKFKFLFLIDVKEEWEEGKTFFSSLKLPEIIWKRKCLHENDHHTLDRNVMMCRCCWKSGNYEEIFICVEGNLM